MHEKSHRQRSIHGGREEHDVKNICILKFFMEKNVGFGERSCVLAWSILSASC